MNTLSEMATLCFAAIVTTRVSLHKNIAAPISQDSLRWVRAALPIPLFSWVSDQFVWKIHCLQAYWKQPNKDGEKAKDVFLKPNCWVSFVLLWFGFFWRGMYLREGSCFVWFWEKTSPWPRQMQMPALDLVTFGLFGPRVSSQITFTNCLISWLLFPL